MKTLCRAALLVTLADAGLAYTAQQRQADLQFIATQLPKLDVNFFSHLNPADFNDAVQSLSAQIPNLTDAEFMVRLAALAAMAGDPHTLLYLDGTAPAYAGFQQFPLSFRWLDDGVFVTRAGPEYSQALGMQLIKVGDTPIAQVIAQLATVIPHANMQWVDHFAQQYLPGQQILQGLDLLPSTPASQLTFQDLSGRQFTLDVTPSNETQLFANSPAQGPIPDYLLDPAFLNGMTSYGFPATGGANYWFTYMAPLRLLYLKYSVCENDPANPFPALAASLLNTLDHNPVDTLVLDFRGNTGGDSSVINPLINGLQQRFSTFLSNPNFRVYDVIDKGTFSSGVDDAMQVKSQDLQAAALYPGLNLAQMLVVIGEPSGGATDAYGNVVPFTLPGSGLAGQYSTKYISTPAYIPSGPSFDPDVPVSIRSTDFFARHDPVLAAILARSPGAPAPPSGVAIAVNGASFRIEQGLAPGSFASVFGVFPSTVDTVLVNGQSGQIVSASTAQINFVLPTTVNSGPATISVRAGGAEVASGQATITAASLGIFVLQPTDAAQPGAVLNQDSSVNSASNPAAAGSIVQIFATGYASAAQVLFGDLPATVLFSGPSSQYPGLWQINAQVPATASGQVPIYAIAGSIASNAVTISVQ
jgi:uncharacterized protein (TIGR03437 family)